MKQHHRLGILILVAVPLAALLVGVAMSPVLSVRQVTIVAPTASLGKEVRNQLQVPVGASMLFYPLNRITEQVERCSLVKDVSVERASAHELRVTVTARQPFFAVADGDGFTIVSRDGVCLYRKAQAPPKLPVFTALIAPRPKPGLAVPPDRLLWAEDLLSGAAKVGLQEGLRVDFTQPHCIQIITPDGLRGMLGNVNSLSRKMMVLGRLVQQLRQESKSPGHIDVSTPETPVWTVKQAPVSPASTIPVDSQAP